jgi:hypothetical protein
MVRFLLIILVAMALLLHNLPYLVRDQVVIWLLNNGAETAELKAINVDWFDGRLSIEGLKASAEGKPALAVDQLSVALDYAQLADERVLLTAVELAGINVGIREQDKQLWLGPLDLNQLTQSDKTVEAEPDAEEGSSNWSFGLKELQLRDINWRAEVAGQKHHLTLSTGRVADFYQWDQDQLVAVDLEGTLNDAPILLSSNSRPLPEEKSSELKVKLKNFPLHSVTAVFLPTLRAHIDLDLSIKAQSNSGSHLTSIVQSGSVRVRNLSYAQEGLQVKEQSLAWNGGVNVALLGSELKSLKTKGELALQGLALTQAGSQVSLDSLKVNSAINLQGLTSLNLSALVLDAKKLQLSQAAQAMNADDLHLTADAINLQDLTQLSLSGLLLDVNQLQLSQAKQRVQVSRLQLSAGAETQDMQIWQATVPTLTLADIDLSAAGESLVTLKGLTLKSAVVQHTDKISLAELEADQLVVEGDGGVFTQWNKISAKGVTLDQLQSLSINQLLLHNSKTRLYLTPKRNLSDLDWLLAQLSSAESNAGSGSKAASSSAPFRVKLNRLSLSGSNTLNVVDRGVKPAFKTQLDISKVELRKLDTAAKGETSFELAAKSKFAKISAKGTMELFSGNYGGHWDAEIKGLELPEVSPYSLEYTGYYLQSGQLTLTTKGTIKDRKLSGDSDIRLNRLEVEARNSERSGEFDQKVSMPLGTAIMVLQDNDSNIDLQIPLEGSLDDPKFGYQTIINKLAGKGLKNAAIGYISNALQPFGALISISQMVMDAQEKGSFITLQPVIFEPAETTLSSESKAYMAKLAEMMNERKGMRMNICGVAVLADKPAIWAQLQETNKQQKAPLDETLLLLELEPALQALAQQRSDAVKTELSDKQGIDSERLFSCYPKVDLKSKDKPQVSLGL